METRAIGFAELKLLVQTGAVLSATLEAVGRGVAISAATRSGHVALRSKAGHLRVFADPRAAFNILRSVGIVDAKLKLAAWAPEQASV
jgi:hypothetical protein